MVVRSQPPSSAPLTPPAPVRWFHLLAGPNGAGKSTLYRALAREGILGPSLEFVNADLYEQAHLQHLADPEARSEAARQWADDRRATLLREGADHSLRQQHFSSLPTSLAPAARG